MLTAENILNNLYNVDEIKSMSIEETNKINIAIHIFLKNNVHLMRKVAEYEQTNKWLKNLKDYTNLINVKSKCNFYDGLSNEYRKEDWPRITLSKYKPLVDDFVKYIKCEL